MKKFFILLLLSICLLCMMGCTSNNRQTQTTDAPSNKVSVMEKHMVSITNDNYQKYLTIETNYEGSSISHHHFRGALSYAFYDNVVITYNYCSGDTITEKTLSLNVGGCGTITTWSSIHDSASYEITNVSGTITYWI